jgi:hypothetical protein
MNFYKKMGKGGIKMRQIKGMLCCLFVVLTALLFVACGDEAAVSESPPAQEMPSQSEVAEEMTPEVPSAEVMTEKLEEEKTETLEEAKEEAAIEQEMRERHEFEEGQVEEQ